MVRVQISTILRFETIACQRDCQIHALSPLQVFCAIAVRSAYPMICSSSSMSSDMPLSSIPLCSASGCRPFSNVLLLRQSERRTRWRQDGGSVLVCFVELLACAVSPILKCCRLQIASVATLILPTVFRFPVEKPTRFTM